MVFVLVGVAFLTLLECRVLGYIHVCKGSNKVGFVVILQPFTKTNTIRTRKTNTENKI
jgi:NADH-ubiquinone oxidoreductase chain 1